jgi:hypothetical protein
MKTFEITSAMIDALIEKRESTQKRLEEIYNSAKAEGQIEKSDDDLFSFVDGIKDFVDFNHPLAMKYAILSDVKDKTNKAIDAISQISADIQYVFLPEKELFSLPIGS